MLGLPRLVPRFINTLTRVGWDHDALNPGVRFPTDRGQWLDISLDPPIVFKQAMSDSVRRWRYAMVLRHVFPADGLTGVIETAMGSSAPLPQFPSPSPLSPQASPRTTRTTNNDDKFSDLPENDKEALRDTNNDSSEKDISTFGKRKKG